MVVPDAAKTYALAELVNLAEQNNPETRVAWENAKARAADLGVSKSTLYPTLAAAVVAQSVRTKILFAPAYIRQTLQSFAPALELDYTVFDFGRRLDEIAISSNDLLAANFLFNDTHRKVIYQVMAAYYRVLNTKGQEDAAEANLKNAQTVQQAAEARLAVAREAELVRQLEHFRSAWQDGHEHAVALTTALTAAADRTRELEVEQQRLRRRVRRLRRRLALASEPATPSRWPLWWRS